MPLVSRVGTVIRLQNSTTTTSEVVDSVQASGVIIMNRLTKPSSDATAKWLLPDSARAAKKTLLNKYFIALLSCWTS